MKSVSAKTTSLLAARQYNCADLYDLTLTTGQVYHLTSWDVGLTASIFNPAAGPFAYTTGLAIVRGEKSQKVGTDGGQLKLTVSPRFDSPLAPVLINGYPITQAARLGILDNAKLQLNRLFMPGPGYVFSGTSVVPGTYTGPDTSAQGNGDFLGTIQDVQVGRLKVDLVVDNYLALLGNQQMPRPLFGPGCWHQVYDPGCTLLKATFTVTGHVTAVTDGAHFNTSLTQADDYFDLGVITFTSGVNNGFAANVTSFKNASGATVLRYPFPVAPAVSDTFSIYPGCDLQQATCSGKFSNLAHFGGQPWIPVPETITDGGTTAPPAQTQGSQAGQIIGSQPTGRGQYGSFTT